MPQILSIGDLRDTDAICERVRCSDEPIFVTDNGCEAMVIMSIDAYERGFAWAEVRRRLQTAEDEFAAGTVPLPYGQVSAKLKKKYADGQ
jgi:PHD/YefM family antitoxin component YafN of YafNO toxin-antitoxin module